MRFLRLLLISICVLALLTARASAQSESASLSGFVTDPSGAAVGGAKVEITDVQTNVSQSTTTNSAGLYLFPNLRPGEYRLSVSSNGFKQAVRQGLVLHVQDTISQNFKLEIGSTTETVSVVADQLNINTTDASVSTVVDRNFAENLPMNGRSFQSLVYLTPGVTLNFGSGTQSGYAVGQFSVNGQRGTANYWTIDGVSANIGISSGYEPGAGAAGSLGGTSVLGGTNSLVSVDALQEFRIQTSTYAPEFGRTPGGQISIVTRSGTNSFHGTAFDYLRNSALDASDWFADANGLPKAQERQNDFGGTLGGPILKDKLFFFFSYEGLRLRLPETGITTVPDLASRQNAIPAMQPFLNGFPLPNPGKPDVGPGIAPADASFVDPTTFDAYSIRVDHNIAGNLNLFGRYSYSPSTSSQRAWAQGGVSLNTLTVIGATTHTGTAGITWTESPQTVNELRFNYSYASGSISSRVDTFDGATIAPLADVLPNGLNLTNAQSIFRFLFGTHMVIAAGKNSLNELHQYNLVDTLSRQEGPHNFKFGVDYRRLPLFYDLPKYQQQPLFLNMDEAEIGSPLLTAQLSSVDSTWLFQNLGLFAQDTWKLNPRLTLTYGIRWDVDFAPRTQSGPSFAAVTGFSLTDLSHLALAPGGTPIYGTRYGNFAPRVGVAYQLSQSPNWGRVVRGGFGVFYDLASSEVGNLPAALNYPFSSIVVTPGGVFPYTNLTVPAIVPPGPTEGTLVGFDPRLNLPYSLEWSFAVEQALGSSQTLTASYVGSAGRRLLASEALTNPNPNYGNAELLANGATSAYNALQVQFQRRLSRGLQVLASYTWSHSIDDGSYGIYEDGSIANIVANKGDSDFDVRHMVSVAFTYNVTAPKFNAFSDAILHGWSIENILQVHSAPPTSIVDGNFPPALFQNSSVVVRPDVVPGQPLYVYGRDYPGGKALNPNAFTNPPADPATGLPTRQGNLGRNALRGFGLTQWDFAVHRDFPIHEGLRLQFRAEMFNILNHPNFAPYDATFGTDPLFGHPTQMLDQYQGGSSVTGGFSSLYNLGGPRSIQLALKLVF
jgi:hypothetical protein